MYSSDARRDGSSFGSSNDFEGFHFTHSTGLKTPKLSLGLHEVGGEVTPLYTDRLIIRDLELVCSSLSPVCVMRFALGSHRLQAATHIATSGAVVNKFSADAGRGKSPNFLQTPSLVGSPD